MKLFGITAAGLLAVAMACVATGTGDVGDGAMVRTLSPDVPIASPETKAPIVTNVGTGGVASVKQDISGVRANAEVGVGDMTGLSVDYDSAMPFGLLVLMGMIVYLSHRREVLRIRGGAKAQRPP